MALPFRQKAIVKKPRQFKAVIQKNLPALHDQVVPSQVGVIPGVVSIKVTLMPTHTQ